MSVSRSLGRASVLGLGAGLAVAAVVLLGLSVQRLRVACAAELSPEECTFERQISADVSRTQALAALGLGCVAAGLFLIGRRRV